MNTVDQAKPDINKRQRLLAEILLISVALSWGLGFPVMKEALMHHSVWVILWMRFLLAAFVILPFALRGIRSLDGLGWRAGAILGIWLFFSFLFLIIGLRYTSAMNTGLLAGLYIIWVPLLAGPLLRKPSNIGAKIGALLGLCGLCIISTQGVQSFQAGDLLVIIGSVFTALHILALDRLTKNHSPSGLAFIQILTVAILSFVMSLFWEQSPFPTQIDFQLIRSLIITAVFATAFAFWVQTKFQKYTTPTRAILIYNLEPIFAALFATWLLEEMLGPEIFLGGSLIIMGMVVSENWPQLSKCLLLTINRRN